MKNRLLPLLFVLGSYSAYSQVIVGEKEIKNPSAQLEVFAKDKGMLIPQVALTGPTDASTITNGNVPSLLVFNTSNLLDIKPGYYYWYDNKWNRMIASGESSDGNGNVIYNPTTNQFTYIDASGNTKIIKISDIIKANETVTTLTDNKNGSYTYVSENGTPTTINVVKDVIDNSKTIFVDQSVKQEIEKLIESGQTLTSLEYNKIANTLTYKDENGKENVILLTDLVKGAETVTTLTDNKNGSYTYVSENGTPTTINVVKDVIDNSKEIFIDKSVKQEIEKLIESGQTLTSLFYDKAANTLTYTDEEKVPHILPLKDLVAGGETQTSLVYDAATNKLTYTGENGKPTVIDLKDLVAGAETLTALDYNKATNKLTFTDEDKQDTVIDLKDLVAGAETLTALDYNKTTNKLTFTDEDKKDTVIDLKDLVKGAETLTTLEDKGNGLYTYTSENGRTTDINVVQDVIDNSKTIFVDQSVKKEIEKLIESGQTLTALDYDKATNKLTFTDEDKQDTVIDLKDLVAGAETLTALDYNKATNKLTFTDEDKQDTVIDLKDLVAGAETLTALDYNKATNKLTFTDEDKQDTVIDLKDLVAGAETLTALDYNKATNKLTFTDEDKQDTVIDLKDLVAGAETLTALDYNKTTNKLTFTDEDKQDTVIDLKDLVAGAETLTALDYNKTTNKLTFTDEDKQDTVIDLKDLVAGAETLTALDYNKTTNKLTFTDEDKQDTVIDLKDLVAGAETLTALDYNKTTNKLTFTDEDKQDTVIDLKDLVAGAETLTALDYNKTTNKLTFTDEDKQDTVIDLKDLVKGAETLTTLEDKGNGLYTYTSENGRTTDINVVKDVIDNSKTIFVDESVKKEIQKLIESGETLTSLSYNPTTNRLTYKAENGPDTVIDLSTVAPKQVVNEIVPTDGQTVFTLDYTPSSLSEVVMYINGVRINKNAFSVDGNKVTYDPTKNGNNILGLDQADNDNVMFDYSK